MNKLIDQFGFDWPDQNNEESGPPIEISEERATLLYIIDVYNKNLFEIDKKPVRKVREILDEFAKELINPQKENLDKVMYKLRQFFSSYRLDEYTYIHKTFDEFRAIIWDFVDQISEEIDEKLDDESVQNHLTLLKEAVESNSIEDLKSQSRQFIDSYIEYQTKKTQTRDLRVTQIKTHLTKIKKKLTDANMIMRRDHLTQAYNRKSFDEQVKHHVKFFRVTKNPVCLITLDIDHFKSFNDNYGHAIGDFVLKELVISLQGLYPRDSDFVARTGGEEFAVILPDFQLEHAQKKAEETLKKIRESVYVHDDLKLKFTVSMGIAQLDPKENIESWMKRADEALYEAKSSGRNKYCLAKEYQKETLAA